MSPPKNNSLSVELGPVLLSADFLDPDIGAVWDLLIPLEYDRDTLLGSLAEWLGSPAGLRLLDCACGSGFPALDLRQRGYDIVCSDASPRMLKRFLRNAEAAGIALSPTQVFWEELGARYSKSFDVVLCRGCSLIYAGTWDSAATPDRSVLKPSVESFVLCLRPGGRLYIDITREADLKIEDTGWMERPIRTVLGHRIEVKERVVAERKNNARRWLIQMRIDGKLFEIDRTSHYITHEQLEDLLTSVALEGVEPIEIPGERYAVFTGQLAAG